MAWNFLHCKEKRRLPKERGGKESHAQILGKFRRGETDILIGTQMIAKGLDFPNVTLVGVVAADMSLQMPDFRAAERTFQLLTQVAGRAGRGDVPGDVYIQTFAPFHPAVQCARNSDYRSFYDQEIVFRREMGYPPFTRLTVVRFTGEDEGAVNAAARALGEALEKAVAAGGGEVRVNGVGSGERRRDAITPLAICRAAEAGDALALEIFDDVADCLATMLASVAYAIQPEAFIIGGGVANAGEILFDPLRRHLNDRLSPYFSSRLTLRPARLGSDAGLIGSAFLALRP